MSQKYDYIASPPDDRDYVYKAPSTIDSISYPAMFKLPINRIEAQGVVGACTAMGVTSAFERLVSLSNNDNSYQASPMFNYSNSRILDAETLNVDNGTTLRSACGNLRLLGICRESTWPFLAKNLSRNPSQAAYDEARTLSQAVNYFEVVRSVNAFKYILSQLGYYITIGFAVYPAFESAQVIKTGDVPDPQPNDVQIAGHAVNLCGWDDATGRFIFINSYGTTSWGNNGLGTLSYNYVMNTTYTSEVKLLIPTAEFDDRLDAFYRFTAPSATLPSTAEQTASSGDLSLVTKLLIVVIALLVLIILYYTFFIRSNNQSSYQSNV